MNESGRRSPSSAAWFQDAAKEFAESKQGKRAAARAALSTRPQLNPASAAAAAALFEAVASGRLPSAGVGYDPWSIKTPTASGGLLVPPKTQPKREVSPQQGLDAILKHISEAGDSGEVMKAGGEWITKITNGITSVIRKYEDED